MTDSSAYNPFPGDSYDTPEHVPGSIVDTLLLHTRASFYLRNFYVFYRSGSACRKGYFPQDQQTRNSYQNILITESCGGKFHLRGLNNLSRFEGPAVLIGNHMSLLETAVMHAFVRPRRNFCFVIKEQLFRVPYFGDIMRTLGCIGVGRKNPRDDFRAVIEEGKKTLAGGKSIVIFPQATRSEVFDPAQFITIGVKLARHAGVPVIPMALRTDFLSDRGNLHGGITHICNSLYRTREILFRLRIGPDRVKLCSCSHAYLPLKRLFRYYTPARPERPLQMCTFLLQI